VKPRSTGTILLDLAIQGVLRTDQGDLVVGAHTFTAQIDVSAELEGIWTRVNDVIVGVVDYPVVQFIGAAGLAAPALAFRRRVRGKPATEKVDSTVPSSDDSSASERSHYM
jgi:hypothetical protein